VKGWAGEVGVACRGVSVAWAARLVTPKGQVVWSSADRLPVGRNADDALAAGVEAIRSAARRHRKHPEAIVTNLRGADLPGVEVGSVPVVLEQAQSMLPPFSEFTVDRLSRVGEHRLTAAGMSGNYDIDLVAETCTCPAFRYRRMLCKHLRTALGLGGQVGAGGHGR